MQNDNSSFERYSNDKQSFEYKMKYYEKCENAVPCKVKFYKDCLPYYSNKDTLYVNIEGPEFDLDFSYFNYKDCKEMYEIFEKAVPLLPDDHVFEPRNN